MTKLNYNPDEITLKNYTAMVTVLDTVQTEIDESEAEKLKIEQEILQLKQEMSASKPELSDYASIYEAAKSNSEVADKIAELERAHKLIDSVMQNKTGDLFVEAKQLYEQLGTEAAEFYTPYLDVLCRLNADETDIVGFKINRMVAEVMSRYNTLLSKTNWLNLNNNVQPKHKGEAIKQLDLIFSGVQAIKGQDLKDLLEVR